jgi:hypothetical protein
MRVDLISIVSLAVAVPSAAGAGIFATLDMHPFLIIGTACCAVGGIAVATWRFVSTSTTSKSPAKKVLRWRRSSQRKRKRLKSFPEDIRNIKPLINTRYSFRESSPPEEMNEEFNSQGDRNSDIFG